MAILGMRVVRGDQAGGEELKRLPGPGIVNPSLRIERREFDCSIRQNRRRRR